MFKNVKPQNGILFKVLNSLTLFFCFFLDETQEHDVCVDRDGVLVVVVGEGSSGTFFN